MFCVVFGCFVFFGWFSGFWVVVFFFWLVLVICGFLFCFCFFGRFWFFGCCVFLFVLWFLVILYLFGCLLVFDRFVALV